MEGLCLLRALRQMDAEREGLASARVAQERAKRYEDLDKKRDERISVIEAERKARDLQAGSGDRSRLHLKSHDWSVSGLGRRMWLCVWGCTRHGRDHEGATCIPCAEALAFYLFHDVKYCNVTLYSVMRCNVCCVAGKRLCMPLSLPRF